MEDKGLPENDEENREKNSINNTLLIIRQTEPQYLILQIDHYFYKYTNLANDHLLGRHYFQVGGKGWKTNREKLTAWAASLLQNSDFRV